jgi:hypothetical protein
MPVYQAAARFDVREEAFDVDHRALPDAARPASLALLPIFGNDFQKCFFAHGAPPFHRFRVFLGSGGGDSLASTHCLIKWLIWIVELRGGSWRAVRASKRSQSSCGVRRFIS